MADLCRFPAALNGAAAAREVFRRKTRFRGFKGFNRFIGFWFRRFFELNEPPDPVTSAHEH
jgi:hypothetical protein